MIPWLVLAKGSGVFGKKCEVNCVWHRRRWVSLQTQILTSRFRNSAEGNAFMCELELVLYKKQSAARLLFYFLAPATEEGAVRERRSSSHKVVFGCCCCLIWNFTFFFCAVLIFRKFKSHGFSKPHRLFPPSVSIALLYISLLLSMRQLFCLPQ